MADIKETVMTSRNSKFMRRLHGTVCSAIQLYFEPLALCLKTARQIVKACAAGESEPSIDQQYHAEYREQLTNLDRLYGKLVRATVRIAKTNKSLRNRVRDMEFFINANSVHPREESLWEVTKDEAFTEVSNPDEAEPHFQEALRINPQDIDIHRRYAILLTTLGRLDEAEVHLQEALRIDPQDIDTHRSYATLLATLGRLDEAEIHAQKVLSVNPQNAIGNPTDTSLLGWLRRQKNG